MALDLSQGSIFLRPNCFFVPSGFGRGRLALTQTGVLRSLEQEEPFDLSQKRPGKGPVFQSDRESARRSSCYEEDEEEDHCYDEEQEDLGPASQSREPCTPQGQSTKAEQAPRALGEASEEEKEEDEQSEGQEKSKDSSGVEGSQESGLREECASLRRLQGTLRGPSFPDYLYFKHRDESLKELLERKMEKQAVLLGI